MIPVTLTLPFDLSQIKFFFPDDFDLFDRGPFPPDTSFGRCKWAGYERRVWTLHRRRGLEGQALRKPTGWKIGPCDPNYEGSCSLYRPSSIKITPNVQGCELADLGVERRRRVSQRFRRCKLRHRDPAVVRPCCYRPSSCRCSYLTTRRA